MRWTFGSKYSRRYFANSHFWPAAVFFRTPLHTLYAFCPDLRHPFCDCAGPSTWVALCYLAYIGETAVSSIDAQSLEEENNIYHDGGTLAHIPPQLEQ